MCETARCVEARLINEQQLKIQSKAQELANEIKEWVAIYKDSHGRSQFIRADLSAGYPIIGYVSPKV